MAGQPAVNRCQASVRRVRELASNVDKPSPAHKEDTSLDLIQNYPEVVGFSTRNSRLTIPRQIESTPARMNFPSDLRKRKTESCGLPSSVSNPKPAPNDVGHAALNRQRPTIAPTVFILLIVGMMFALFPIFYYTQVMIPDPESTSILSSFRIKGNVILNALGHSSSSGDGRIPFNSKHHHQPSTQPPSLKNIHAEKSALAEEEKERTPPSSLGLITETDTKNIIAEPTTQSEDEKDNKTPLSPEKQKKLDEELGKFWEASSRYRREAQKQKTGEYSLQGDGASSSKETEGASNIPHDEALLDHLPEADPDAKDGLTPEFWDAIKDQLNADDLTLVLNDMRRSEQAAQSKKT
ncbi:hypothetical protein PCASD_13493 [Puccinia coronata f. sp. avenae]|uniref:Uncharacterized protein n=2 Tax=Puccinia coronata f. sp. avenae TaxID=200324 RepID=A0A2N5TEF7_9BASI|nr:hypothetical protein PCASD_13493 [Puccinia coronata f. sp. avenae]